MRKPTILVFDKVQHNRPVLSQKQPKKLENLKKKSNCTIKEEE